MDFNNAKNTREESRVWQATRETQGSITILDPSIFD